MLGILRGLARSFYSAHLAIFVLILQNMLGKRQLRVIAPNVSDVFLKAYFRVAARLAYIR